MAMAMKYGGPVATANCAINQRSASGSYNTIGSPSLSAAHGTAQPRKQAVDWQDRRLGGTGELVKNLKMHVHRLT